MTPPEADPAADGESPAAREQRERAAIVARYDRGHAPGAAIDAWEDPKLEIYHVTDRFGFVHDSRLPSALSAEERQQNRLETERTKKWLDMLAKMDRSGAQDSKFRSRVYKGIPNVLRGVVWMRLLRVEEQQQLHGGVYEQMRSDARLFSPEVRQIDLDVNRTFRDNTMFRERYGTKQQALFHVLAAYSMYNSELGYCQGMSQIAALLLMYMNEEEAFWALSMLMTDTRYRMHGLFIHGFPKLMRLQAHHNKIMKKYLPKLKKHLDKNGIDTGIYTLKWFFQCFLDRVPFTLALRLWDTYLLDGEVVLIAGAFMILRSHKKTLMRLPMEDILDFLQVRLQQNFQFSDDAAIQELTRCLHDLASGKLDRSGEPADAELPQRPMGRPPPRSPLPLPAPPPPATAAAVTDTAPPPPAPASPSPPAPASPSTPPPAPASPSPPPPASAPVSAAEERLRAGGDALPWSSDGLRRRSAEPLPRSGGRHKSAPGAGPGRGWAASVERRRPGGDGEPRTEASADKRASSGARHVRVGRWSAERTASPPARRPAHLSLTRLNLEPAGAAPAWSSLELATPASPGTVSIYVTYTGRRSPAASSSPLSPGSSKLSLRSWGSSPGSASRSGSLEPGPPARVSLSPAGATLVTIRPDTPDGPASLPPLPPLTATPLTAAPAHRSAAKGGRSRRVPILLEASGLELR